MGIAIHMHGKPYGGTYNALYIFMKKWRIRFYLVNKVRI